MPVDVLLGLQWGDEGKGKIVDYLSGSYDCIARFQGGPNAGHTIIIGDNKYVLHTIPSGVFREKTRNIIGNGVVIDPITLVKEIRMLEGAGIDIKDRLKIARKAHLILPTHRALDAASEKAKGKEKIGSTLRGIGPTYMDKTGRNGLRIGDIEASDFRSRYEKLFQKHQTLLQIYPKLDTDLKEEEDKWFEAIDHIKTYDFIDCEYYINKEIDKGKSILAEGAQGSMLDIEYGTYPYVTSSNTITAGVCTGLGIAPGHIKEVIGISKAYCTRVGSGPFPTELEDETGELLRKEGQEFGATTGRPRRCGWLDLIQLQYSIMLNGVTQLAITKADVLNRFDKIGIGTSYSIGGASSEYLPFDLEAIDDVNFTELDGWGDLADDIKVYSDLPKPLHRYCDFIEDFLSVNISMISVGPERSKLILKP
ncbi:MAG: adenylosuccinate synthase [Saprospiraceae bacterium]|nr:adenylosuccinate synthase [Saprospiraceae bacterium]